MSAAQIPLAGVIGHPIGHSKSPKLHGHWLATLGISGFYIPMDVRSDDLETVLRSLPKMGFRGVNVTIPHKEQALEIADQVSVLAARIGAANTLTFDTNGVIHADNTDGYGFLANLDAGASNWQTGQGPSVVLGAGGAARAVIAALLDRGVSRIQLANRTRARAEGLKTVFGDCVSILDWDAVDVSLEDASLLVNTTSLGMTGGDALPMTLETLSPDCVVTDLVYTPLETELLKNARSKGCQTVDGLGMLLHQGVPGFERWFGVRPDVTAELRSVVLT